MGFPFLAEWERHKHDFKKLKMLRFGSIFTECTMIINHIKANHCGSTGYISARLLDMHVSGKRRNSDQILLVRIGKNWSVPIILYKCDLGQVLQYMALVVGSAVLYL